VANTKPKIVYLDRECDKFVEFQKELGVHAEVAAFKEIDAALDALGASANAVGYFDIATFAEADMAQVDRFIEFRRKRPIALVTDQDLADYIHRLRQWGSTKVLIKTPPYDQRELEVFLDMVTEPSYGFGLISHLESTIQMFSLAIDSIPAKTKGIDRVIEHFLDKGFKENQLYDVRLILEELINNALFHAFRNASGEEKYWINDFDKLGDEESVRVEYGSDRRYVGFSVTDSAGQLPISVLFSKLERQFSPEGIFDESGRGIYLTRMMASRLIVNLEKDSRTQMISLFAFDKENQPPVKPFVVNFVGDDEFEEWRSDSDLD